VKSTISVQQHVSKNWQKKPTAQCHEGRLKGFRFVQRIQTQQHHETAAVDGKGLEDQLGC